MVRKDAHAELDSAIREVDALRRNLKKGKGLQVRASSEVDLCKATALAWFNSHYPVVRDAVGEDICSGASAKFHTLLGLTDKASARTKYDQLLKAIKTELSGLRKFAVVSTSSQVQSSSDQVPDFTNLIGDKRMQGILSERWRECVICVESRAPLAATVMMGGLLETLLLARFNKESNKSVIFNAATAPKDKKTKKTLQLKEWTLRNYLDVGHELTWISRSTKDVGEVVRDFRNYIHPYKQASHGVTLVSDDAKLFWQISKEIVRQLLENNSK